MPLAAFATPLVKQVLPVLEMALDQQNPLLMVAEKLDGEALSTIVKNVTAGVVRVVEVDPPAYAEGRRKCMEDLAIFTGATYVDHELMGYTMGDVTPSMLGHAQRVVVGRNSTQVIGGAGDVQEIRNRVADLRRRIAETDYEFNKQRMTERLSRLTGGRAVIRVGGVSEENVNERKLRLVVCALEEPLRRQAANAGEVPGMVLDKVRTMGHGTVFDAQGLRFVNANEAGIIDPAKVCLDSLQCAASVASTLLTTEGAVVDAEPHDLTIMDRVCAAAGMAR